MRSLVTNMGVFTPAHLPANGRSVLYAYDAAQVRAFYPDRESLAWRREGTATMTPRQ